MTFSLKVSLTPDRGDLCVQCLRVHLIAVVQVLKDNIIEGVLALPLPTRLDS
jgi:hypothetical protein